MIFRQRGARTVRTYVSTEREYVRKERKNKLITYRGQSKIQLKCGVEKLRWGSGEGVEVPLRPLYFILGDYLSQ